MSGATVSLGGTAGERITIAMVLLTLCVEVLADNGCRDPIGQPMTLELCREACGEAYWLEPRVAKLGSWECECVRPSGDMVE